MQTSENYQSTDKELLMFLFYDGAEVEAEQNRLAKKVRQDVVV